MYADLKNADQRDPRTHAVIGAAMEVHRQLGCGFLEAVYQDALALEFAAKGIPFKQEIELPVYYKGQRLAHSYRVDFLCFENLVVELKAIQKMTAVEEAQVINYLRVGNFENGLLVNFGETSLKFKRFANQKNLRTSA